MGLTDSRVRSFCRDCCDHLRTPIGFVDVGSGGTLKDEWLALPPEAVATVQIDPESWTDPEQMPICISDRLGSASFNVARDPRASSLFPVNEQVVERFGLSNLRASKTIDVSLTTLDDFLVGRYEEIDVMDINVEGHDLQVLRGGKKLLESTFFKCIKIEFEHADVWHGQGRFGEIDNLLRDAGYDLVRLEVASMRPVVVRRLSHPGEPVWGKAWYMPSVQSWRRRRQEVGVSTFCDDVIKGVVLGAAIRAPGRAVDLLEVFGELLASGAERWRRDLFSAYRFSELEDSSIAAWRAVGKYLRGMPYYCRCAIRRSLDENREQ